MAGPSGFETRKKGRTALAEAWIPAGGLYIAGVQVSASLTAADLSGLAGWATVSTAAVGSTIANSGVTEILSTAAAVYNIAAPFAGAEKVISILNGSSAVMIKTSSTGYVILGGSTTNGGSTTTTTMKSTVSLVATAITLFGLSTTQWTVTSIYPTTLGHVAFSTTT